MENIINNNPEWMKEEYKKQEEKIKLLTERENMLSKFENPKLRPLKIVLEFFTILNKSLLKNNLLEKITKKKNIMKTVKILIVGLKNPFYNNLMLK